MWAYELNGSLPFPYPNPYPNHSSARYQTDNLGQRQHPEPAEVIQTTQFYTCLACLTMPSPFLPTKTTMKFLLLLSSAPSAP